jgi:radial spoke head protein 3
LKLSQERHFQARELARARRKKETLRQKMTEKQRYMSNRVSTPPPVRGRVHMDVQTETYLEELSDRPPERDESTQTDALKDRPPSPLFIPEKSGVDKETQIEEGDLFDFDAEVAPILEVLVGKTLEQGMDEVLEEEEIANIRAQKARFEQQRNIELAKVQRLEAEARRRDEEKTRRVEQERSRIALEKEMIQKIASRGFAKTFFNDLQRDIMNELSSEGQFFDPIACEVEMSFLPWLQERVLQHHSTTELASKVCDGMYYTSLSLSLSLFFFFFKLNQNPNPDILVSSMSLIPKKVQNAKDAYQDFLNAAEDRKKAQESKEEEEKDKVEDDE